MSRSASLSNLAIFVASSFIRSYDGDPRSPRTAPASAFASLFPSEIPVFRLYYRHEKIHLFHTLRFVLSDSIEPSFAFWSSPTCGADETGFTVAVIEFVDADVPVITDPVDLISFPNDRNESEAFSKFAPDGAGLFVLAE